MNLLPVMWSCVHHKNHIKVYFCQLGRWFGAKRQAESKACGTHSLDGLVVQSLHSSGWDWVCMLSLCRADVSSHKPP